MKVARVPLVSSVEDWSRVHPKADIKRVEPISYQSCGITLTDFLIYYEELLIPASEELQKRVQERVLAESGM